MFFVALEDYNAVQTVLMLLPKNILLGEFVIVFVLGGSLLLYNWWRLMLRQEPVFILPEGQTRVTEQELKQPVECANCLNPLKQIGSASVFAHLTKPPAILAVVAVGMAGMVVAVAISAVAIVVAAVVAVTGESH